MRERPILFSAPMVRALLAGTKTQTRRVVNGVKHVGGAWRYGSPAGLGLSDRGDRWSVTLDADHLRRMCSSEAYGWGAGAGCPYGQPGDRLWVRETFAIVPRTAYRCSEGVQQTLRPEDDHDAAIYRAGWDRSTSSIRWRPSIHMPRWASRITLEITGVRVERLQDISTADCWAEGISASPDVDPVHEYRDLWESINGPGSWDANPWVWVIEFRRV